MSYLLSGIIHRDVSPSNPVYISGPLWRDPQQGIELERARIPSRDSLIPNSKKDQAFPSLIRDLEVQDPLNPREALYGGCTNATRLYCCEGNMWYVDVCSLYQYVLNTNPFPSCTRRSSSRTCGLISDRSSVTSFHPEGFIIPHSLTGPEENYCFPYVAPVQMSVSRTPITVVPTTRHSAVSRELGWVTTELHKAWDCGYRLDKIYEVWNFPRQSVDLFWRYIDTSLKIKQEASGFPPQCQTEEQKQSYIEDIFRREKILLDSINIGKEDHSKIVFELLMGKIRSASTIAKDSIQYGTRGIKQTLGRQYHFIERDGTLEWPSSTRIRHDFS